MTFEPNNNELERIFGHDVTPHKLFKDSGKYLTSYRLDSSLPDVHYSDGNEKCRIISVWITHEQTTKTGHSDSFHIGLTNSGFEIDFSLSNR